MAQNIDTATKIPANAPRLADKVKKLQDSIKLHIYKERGEEHHDLEVTEVEHDGKIVGRYVKHGDKIVESHGSHDAQTSGIHEKVAKKVGQKKEDIVHTAPTAASKDAHDKKDDLQRETHSHEADKAKIGEGKEKEVKPKEKPKESKKPDNSMSKMASMESAETQGAPDLSKSYSSVSEKMAKMCHMCKSGLNKAYDIKVEPGKIVYEKVDPKTREGHANLDPTKKPTWKTKWEAKGPAARQAFRSKLSQQRGQRLASSEGSSVSEKFKHMCGSLRKNVAMGYPEMGIPPMGMSDKMEKKDGTSQVSGVKPPKPNPDLDAARKPNPSPAAITKPMIADPAKHFKAAEKNLKEAMKITDKVKKTVLV